MIEPARTNGYIHLRRPPAHFLGFCEHLAVAYILCHGVDAERIVVGCRLRENGGHKGGHTPFGFASHSAFVANPAHVVTGNGEHCFRLKLLHDLAETIPVIFLFLSVGTFAAGSVKPHFIYFSVVGEQFGELCHKLVVVSLRVTVFGRIPVPWRQVYAQFHAVFVACVAKFFHNIALAVFPRRACNRVVGGLCGPQAKSVMVFGCEYHKFESGVLKGFDPLLGVKLCRVE